MVSPPVQDGGVLFAGGQILAVGPFPELRRSAAEAEVIDAGNAVVLPGLVNAHVHLELSKLHPPAWQVEESGDVDFESNAQYAQ